VTNRAPLLGLWDDTFERGAVFTAEPGLYREALRAGVRVEQVNHLTAAGFVRLTGFPTDLSLSPQSQVSHESQVIATGVHPN
jgi:hypothetical protein